jgi:hypothetical protein
VVGSRLLSLETWLSRDCSATPLCSRSDLLRRSKGGVVRYKATLVGFALLVQAGGVGCSDDSGPGDPAPGGSAGSGGAGGSGGTAGSGGQGGSAGSPGGSSGSGGTAAGTGGQDGGGASGSSGSGGGAGDSCTRDPERDAACADFMVDTPNAWICPTLPARSALQRQYDNECWSVNFVSGYGHCCPT